MFAASNRTTDGLASPLGPFIPEMNWRRRVDTVSLKFSSRDPQFKGGNRMESSAAKQESRAGDRMLTAQQTYLRTELEHRRERLHAALHSPAADASLSQLLTAVD